jgi:hypothetical protein
MCMSNFCMSTEIVQRIDTLVTRYNRTATPLAGDGDGRLGSPRSHELPKRLSLGPFVSLPIGAPLTAVARRSRPGCG